MTNLRMVYNNICFRAHEDEVISDSEEPFTLEESENAYIELEKDFKKSRKSCFSLKKEHIDAILELINC